MKKIVPVLLILALCTTTHFAQAQTGTSQQEIMQKWKALKKSPDQKAKILSDTMNTVCALSPDDFQKIYALNLDFFKQKESIREQFKQSQDKEQFQQQNKALSKTRKEQLAAALTPGQLTAWENWKQAHKKQMQDIKQQYKQNHSYSGNKQNKDKIQPLEPVDTSGQDIDIFGE